MDDREFLLKWEMGMRGACAIVQLLSNMDAKIEIHSLGLWFDAKKMMDFLLATGGDGTQALKIRASGPDAERAWNELARVFECDARIPCACGKPRLIGWDRSGAMFVCANDHRWSPEYGPMPKGPA